MNDRKLLLALLAKTLNKPESELLPLLFVADADGKFADDAAVKPDALTVVLAADATRIAGLGKTERESGYSRGKSESLTAFETELRNTYGITEAKTGKELVEAIVELKAGAAKDKKITDDEVKKHPAYIQLADKVKTESDAAAKKVQDEFDAYKANVSKTETRGKLSKDVKQIVDAGKYILSPDAAKAERQLADLNRDLEEFDVEYQTTGNVTRIVLLKDGKVVMDDHGHPVTLEGKVKELADSRWDVQPAEARSGTGIQKAGNATPANKDKPEGAITYEWKGKVPANDDEYVKEFEKLTDENQQVALTNAYTASKKA